MKGWTRWLVLGLGALVALLAIAAAGLAYLVSQVDVRAEIERAVESATGRDLTIAGDVGVSFWPVIGLRAQDATLANVEGGRAPAFLTTDDIHVGVEIRPLFERRVVVREVVIERPNIALEVGADGRPNWILAPASTGEPTPPPSEEVTVDVNRASLRELRIRDGEVSYFDARSGSGWVVGDVDIDTAVTSLDEPMRIEGSVVYAEQAIDLEFELGQPSALIRNQRMPLKLKLESELLDVDFDGQTLAASGEIAGLVEASGPSLRRLASWIGSPLQSGVGLEPFAVSGRIEVAGGRYSFSNAGFALDRIRGRGDFELSRLRDRPYVSGRLELFDLDLNPYITGQAPALVDGAPVVAPTTADDAPSPTTEIAAVAEPPRAVDVQAPASDAPIDLSGLRTVDADLELVTGVLLVQRMRIDSARLNLVLNDGYMAATLQELALYGGSGSGRFELDARQPRMRIVQELTVSNVEARPFLTDAANFANIEGRAELSLSLTTLGASQSELIRTADGRMHLEVVSGTLHGVDLGGVSRTVRNALRGELTAPEARTPFQGFSATFALGDGVLASDNVSFNTPDLRIPGLVVVDLPQRRIDARLAPRSAGSFIVFPFSARGPFTGPLAYDHDIGDRTQREIRAMIARVRANARAN
jgi:AsmA protein